MTCLTPTPLLSRDIFYFLKKKKVFEIRTKDLKSDRLIAKWVVREDSDLDKAIQLFLCNSEKPVKNKEMLFDIISFDYLLLTKPKLSSKDKQIIKRIRSEFSISYNHLTLIWVDD